MTAHNSIIEYGLIDSITIGERHRKDMGDIAGLAASIKAIGLIHPVAVTFNETGTGYDLIAGARRIAAYKLLGRDTIPMRVVSIDAIVLGELAENEVRKDFTVSERVAIGKVVEAHLGERRGRDNPQNFAELKGTETRQIAAEKAGFGNAETYRQAKTVIGEGADELVAAVESEAISISAGAKIAAEPVERQREIVTEKIAASDGRVKRPRSNRRLERFENAIHMVLSTCENAAEHIDIPDITTKQAAAAIKKITEAERALLKLKRRLSGSTAEAPTAKASLPSGAEYPEIPGCLRRRLQ